MGPRAAQILVERWTHRLYDTPNLRGKADGEEQCTRAVVLKSAPRTRSISIIWAPVEMNILRLQLIPTESQALAVGPRSPQVMLMAT